MDIILMTGYELTAVKKRMERTLIKRSEEGRG